MFKKCVVGCFALLGSNTALGAPASSSVDRSKGTADASATGDLPAADGFGNNLELGVFTNIFFPSPRHTLYSYEPQREYEGFTRYGFGARAGFYPTPWLGLEVEAMHARGAMRLGAAQEGRRVRAHFNGYRGQFALQLPSKTVVPFIVLGGGVLQALSAPMGGAYGPAGHAGLGLKIALTRDLALRLEARENVSERDNDRYGKLAFHEEVQLGLSALLGVPVPPPPRPVPDRDGDTVADGSDKCPDVPALTADGCPLDSDSDGVNDEDDYCPREAGVAPKGCPELDEDKDGVLLPCDLCPSEEGVKPDGCPIKDTDNDGIFDDKDRCPKDPETINGYEDADGCPDELPKEVEAFTGAIQGIQFEQGSAKIRANSSSTLGKAAAVLIKYNTIRLEISGHTSSEGDPDFNDKLSLDRATAVKDWLTNADVDPDRIVVRGEGSNQPVADNKTRAGRAKNRRIEFKIITQ
jgi:OOP family OmpA-OmpF porin